MSAKPARVLEEKNVKDREFLIWLHERLEHVHGENPLIDYMHRLRKLIWSISPDKDISQWKDTNSLQELKNLL